MVVERYGLQLDSAGLSQPTGAATAGHSVERTNAILVGVVQCREIRTAAAALLNIAWEYSSPTIWQAFLPTEVADKTNERMTSRQYRTFIHCQQANSVSNRKSTFVLVI